MSAPYPPESPNPAVNQAAADWLARRDRGLSPAEQDAFLQWLRENPLHRSELARLEKTWGALNLLAEWRPDHSARPNPDLLAEQPRSPRRRLWLTGTALAAASLAFGLFAWFAPRGETPASTAALRVIPAPERVTLADGSSIAANEGGVFEADFTASVRRVRLRAGEAHFTVARDAGRPFVVETEGGIAVRALGTAFNVRCAEHRVEVLVTAGKVQVEQAPRPRSATPAGEPTPLSTGQQASIDLTRPTSPPVVVDLNPAQIERSLAWQGVRLVFDELPLATVVTEFNLRNRQQLVIADPSIAGIRVAGSFRADNVEAFSRLLEASFGVVVERRADGTLLLRRDG